MPTLVEDFGDDFTMFLDSLTSLLQDDTFSIDTPRNKRIMQAGTSLRERIQIASDNDPIRQHISSIVCAVKSVESSGSSNANRLKKYVENFHSLREGRVLDLWENLSDFVALSLDPILVQSTTERLMLKVLRASSLTALPSSNQSAPVRQLTDSEECAVMYCGGYVVRKLEKRMCREQSPSAAKYVAALQNLCEEECEMADNEEFDDFVRRWMDKISRGGLKILKDEALEVFKHIELCVYAMILQSPHALDTPKMIQSVLDNVHIQFLWCMLVVDLNEQEPNTLLSNIVQLWITIRGHTHASALVEKYNWSVSEQTQKSKGVRKALKFSQKD